MRRAALIGVMFLFECACVIGEETVRSEKPKVESQLRVIGTNIVNLGEIYNHTVTNVAFKLVNTGKTPTKITRLIPTCQCISGMADTNAIPPNGETEVLVRLDASSVRGDFERSLWVQSGTPSELHILTLSGVTVPLFRGAPSSIVHLKFKHPGESHTNRFTVTASSPGFFIGTPEVKTNGTLDIGLTIVTNQNDTASYTITVVSTPVSFGSAIAMIGMPVIGQVKSSPLVIRLQAVVGKELTASKRQFAVQESSLPQTFYLELQGKSRQMAPENLTWEPKMNGLSIICSNGQARYKTINVKIELTPEATKEIAARKKVELCFFYPNHQPINVFLIAGGESVINNQEDDRYLRRRTHITPNGVPPHMRKKQ